MDARVLISSHGVHFSHWICISIAIIAITTLNAHSYQIHHTLLLHGYIRTIRLYSQTRPPSFHTSSYLHICMSLQEHKEWSSPGERRQPDWRGGLREARRILDAGTLEFQRGVSGPSKSIQVHPSPSKSIQIHPSPSKSTIPRRAFFKTSFTGDAGELLAPVGRGCLCPQLKGWPSGISNNILVICSWVSILSVVFVSPPFFLECITISISITIKAAHMTCFRPNCEKEIIWKQFLENFGWIVLFSVLEKRILGGLSCSRKGNNLKTISGKKRILGGLSCSRLGEISGFARVDQSKFPVLPKICTHPFAFGYISILIYMTEERKKELFLLGLRFIHILVDSHLFLH